MLERLILLFVIKPINLLLDFKSPASAFHVRYILHFINLTLLTPEAFDFKVGGNVLYSRDLKNQFSKYDLGVLSKNSSLNFMK